MTQTAKAVPAVLVQFYDADQQIVAGPNIPAANIAEAVAEAPSVLVGKPTGPLYLTMPIADRFAQWLLSQYVPAAWMTIDGPYGRWSGRLSEHEIPADHPDGKTLLTRWVRERQPMPRTQPRDERRSAPDRYRSVIEKFRSDLRKLCESGAR